MPGDNVLQDGPEFLYQFQPLLGLLQVFSESMEIPEGRVHGIVFRRLAEIREAVRQHSFADKSGKGGQNIPCYLRAPCREAEAWQGDHGIAPPIGEPGIARDQGAAYRRRGTRYS